MTSNSNIRFLVTGATGTIGKCATRSLVQAGHTVTALVRNQQSKDSLEQEFGPNLIGVIYTLTSEKSQELVSLATGFDCIVHTAFSLTPDSFQVEEATMAAFIEAGKATAAAGQNSHFISTSGFFVLGETGEETVGDDASTANPFPFAAMRVPHESLVLNSAEGNFITSVVRSSWVYGGSMVEKYVNACKSSGKVVVPVANKRICMIHKEDIGNLYRLIGEKRAPGMFNCCEPAQVSGEEVLQKLTALVGSQNIIRYEDPMPHMQEFGFFPIGLNLNQVVSTPNANAIGWQPAHNFLQEFEQLYA